MSFNGPNCPLAQRVTGLYVSLNYMPCLSVLPRDFVCVSVMPGGPVWVVRRPCLSCTEALSLCLCFPRISVSLCLFFAQLSCLSCQELCLHVHLAQRPCLSCAKALFCLFAQCPISVLPRDPVCLLSEALSVSLSYLEVLLSVCLSCQGALYVSLSFPEL